jgi:voltage-gated potassium channel
MAVAGPVVGGQAGVHRGGHPDPAVDDDDPLGRSAEADDGHDLFGVDAATERASKIIVATDEDDTSVLVTLTARRLAPKAEIVAAAREAANAQILRQSGASSVIPTAESAGHLMALSLLSPVAGTLMEDLLDSGRGLEVIQRDITKEELGVSPTEVDATGQIVLAVIRDDVVHRFDTSDIRILQKGDQLVVIRHTESNGYSVTPPPAS